MKYRIIIEQDEEGVLVMQGKTRKEALANIHEALEVYLESLPAHGEPIPPTIDEEVIEMAM